MNRESIPGFEAGTEAPRGASRALDTPSAWLAWGVPLLLGLGAASSEPGWADDLGIVRDLGFVRVGFEGAASTLLGQLMALLPIGGRFLRLSLIGVFALAFASRLLFENVRALLDRRGPAPIHPLLALLASSLWALGPAVLGEATRAGGALVAVALVLLVLRLLPAAFEAGDPRALVATGLAAGAAGAECHAAGACLGLVLLGAALAWPERSWGRHAGSLLASTGFAFALLSSLCWIRPASAPVLPAPDAIGLVPALETGARAALVQAGEAFFHAGVEFGLVPLALAGVGAGLALRRRASLRGPFLPWLMLGLAGFVAAFMPGSPAAPAFGAVVPNLALAAFFPVALAQGITLLWGSRLPFGRHAAVLTLTFAGTLVLSRADRALLERPSSASVEAWTQAALGALPPSSLLLVQTPALAQRLLAARVLAGARPDVVIVPAPFIGTGSIGRDLSRREPSLAPLLRQLYVNGSSDEYSLSRLADQRPVLVELDRAWDRRVLEHLRPAGLWFGFSAAAPGSADRRVAAASAISSMRRSVQLSGGLEALDGGTRRAFADALGAQALALATLERDEPARRLLRAARRLDRKSRRVREARQLLGEGERGRVAASPGME